MKTTNLSLTVYDHAFGLFETAEGRLERLLDRFRPISLSDMESVALFNRVDTKYIFGVSQLLMALQPLVGQYRILEIEDIRLSQYSTLYFDTPDFYMYQQHHNGLGTRYKVRTRQYVDSDLAFFEIKHKTNQGRTIKSRFQTPRIYPRLGKDADAFVSALTPVRPDRLEPKLWNNFKRMTLVSNDRPERLTIDINVAFNRGNTFVELPGIAIAEVKQEHRSQDSDFIQQMRALGIRPTPFSKYCVGASLLYEHLKRNNFKDRLRLVEKVMQGEVTHGFVH